MSQKANTILLGLEMWRNEHLTEAGSIETTALPQPESPLIQPRLIQDALRGPERCASGEPALPQT
jgi:hypothetical protein